MIERCDFHVEVLRVEQRVTISINGERLGEYDVNRNGWDAMGEDLGDEVYARLQGPAEPRHGGHVG